MPPLLSTDKIHPLPRLDERVHTCCNTLYATQIRRRTECNLLLLRNIIIAHLVDS